MYPVVIVQVRCDVLRAMMVKIQLFRNINPLNPEINPICYLLALLAHHFLPR